MGQTSISFKSKKTNLEGILSVPNGHLGLLPAAILCHPHPLFGGNMDNNVIIAVSTALNSKGIATFRFNFKGVAPSERISSNGASEQEDLASALRVVKKLSGIDHKRLGLVGYSFGAQIILLGIKKYNSVKTLALISPPLSALNSNLNKDDKYKLFVVGSKDGLVEPNALKEHLDTLSETITFREVLGADHSWRGHEESMANQVAEFLQTSL